MPIQLFDHLLLLAAIVCASTLVRLLRRTEGIGRGYALVVGACLVGSVLAIGGDRFFGVLALAAVVLTVILPWALEHASRWAFARGYLVWVKRLSSLRSMLMPGSGLSRQLPILEGLALLDRKGVDAALAHFRRLADEAENPAELAVIHEQIIAMLFHGRRWDEGIAYYERRFQVDYAAVRPNLALGLLRAYGEAGQLETAAGLLRALDEGPLAGDPNAAELIGQAWLTFLAYAGAVEPVGEIVERRGFAVLGLTPATAMLFKGIALTRAGDPKRAVETLSAVEDLAGPRDYRVLAAARSLLEDTKRAPPPEPPEPEAASVDERGPADGLADSLADGELTERERAGSTDEVARADPWAAVAKLGPELSHYVSVITVRLRGMVFAGVPVRGRERTWVTTSLMVVLSMVYGVHLLRGGGSVGLLELGAMSEDLSRAGSWGRVFTSAWIHVDLVALLFDVYAIWLAGQVVERMLGSARMAWATMIAAFAGVAASVSSLPLLWYLGLDGLAIVAPTAGNLMAVGAITAALWQLLPSRSRAVLPRSRRNLVVTLTLLLVANLLTSWPGLVGFGVAPIALLVTILVASLTVLWWRVDASKTVRRVLGAGVALALVANLVALVLVIREDPEAYLIDHRAQRCELGGVVVRTPIDMAATTLDRDVPFALPIVDGLLDTLELRDGSLVQLAVHRASGGGPAADEPALFGLIEGIEDELTATAPGPLPEQFAELIADKPGSWRAWDLWRNGQRIGRVVEYQLPDAPPESPATIMLLATPPQAIDHAPAIYATILRQAWVSPDAAKRPRCRVQ